MRINIGSTLISFEKYNRGNIERKDNLIYMQIYVVSSTLAQNYGRICVNDIGTRVKKTCLRLIALLKRRIYYKIRWVW